MPERTTRSDRVPGAAGPGPVEIALPPSHSDLAHLRAGDEVLLTGPVFAARDATHERLLAELDATGELPFGLEGHVLFYAGPTPATPARPAGSVGPTTAKRMDAATPRLLAAGIVATIGKGGRSEAVRLACAEHSAVYFAAVGGAAAFLGSHVTGSKPIAWSDLGTEALVELTLERFPAFVGIDTLGTDLYADARTAWQREAVDEGR